MKLFTPLVLPNGAVIPNRLAKAAMEENMADADHAPSDALLRLYDAWAKGKAGLILTGNVMVDHRAMTGPNGVVLEDDAHLDRFRRWAEVARAHGAHIWMQINHPGRQMAAALGQTTLAPSAVPLALGALSKQFPVPREMTDDDIAGVQRRFVQAARLAERSGFTGVQIHAAHGYLLSQFLSPITNRRQDRWGGSIENRARLLLDIVRAVRDAVSPGFAVSVKLNSADFQRGGFSSDDAKRVVEMLNPLGVDLVELSGGSYEAPAMQGQARDGRTLAREAYFLEFARDIAAAARMPLMVTGGIRRRAVAEQVVDSGVAMVGIATALSVDPNLPRDWLAGGNNAPALRPIVWKNKVLGSLANMAVVKFQLKRLSEGRVTNPRVSPLRALLLQQLSTSCQTRRYRRWTAARAAR
ncbi:MULTISPECIES: NADH:flavin oxidoreductase/NADH oxidase family protein [Burkholderia]|uniref:NADH:flavin oxidoreductase/NADH oxidase family protein n=1 Tax=Burkholderia TaxID=32008 RepID=UPI000758CF53|nr:MULTISPECIES: NADH:flavin oxidoreductase/NADH oxidase family protein [Burkholderia]AOJ71489.1 2,4-dienoyl-CoA reductase [Burkholderia savannae]KVG37119.1 2,4-dienoyl-CoA reductase [Burkholderia sp. MSMB0265]KVG77744.1 2,4-dienoyl-CoA reductase [Burkholderia sp. MSMB2040]KVG94177.1 2,4-dienoyl-CoA reductase [Burkholderia sp. MSMB2042]KVG97662.1 2,4-dienoyl-CoA reductase [Burkholderia sp. MSMB2041]